MSHSQNQNQSAQVPTPREIELMADVLRARLGADASNIAMFFANEQKALGDEERYEAWAHVAEQINKLDVNAAAREATARRH